jgi:methylated-DNA-[protein]-cysteine S-methyltransferase
MGDLETGSPLLGVVCIAITARGLLELQLTADPDCFHERLAGRQGDPEDPNRVQLPAYLNQIREYLDGKRRRFEMPIDWTEMSPFMAKVLHETSTIHFGQLRTYSGLAAAIDQPKGARPVGSVMAANPIAIVLPCHRVVGVDHSLHGYGAPGGLDAKAWLLSLEGWTVEHHRVVGESRALS